MGKPYRNIFWGIAAALAIGALIYNPFHLATASIIFILGAFQDEED